MLLLGLTVAAMSACGSPTTVSADGGDGATWSGVGQEPGPGQPSPVAAVASDVVRAYAAESSAAISRAGECRGVWMDAGRVAEGRDCYANELDVVAGARSAADDLRATVLTGSEDDFLENTLLSLDAVGSSELEDLCGDESDFTYGGACARELDALVWAYVDLAEQLREWGADL